MPEPVLAPGLSEEQLRKVEEFIEEEEGRFNRYRGWLVPFLTAIAVASSAFHMYAAKEIVRTDLLREIHVAIALILLVIAPVNSLDLVGVACVASALIMQVLRGRILARA